MLTKHSSQERNALLSMIYQFTLCATPDNNCCCAPNKSEIILARKLLLDAGFLPERIVNVENPFLQ